jgi:hypothetical protein
MENKRQKSTIDISGLNLEEISGATILDAYILPDDGDGEELWIILNNGKQIEISLHDEGFIIVQSD